MSKLHLWVLNHYAHPPDLPGGTRHFDLGRELVRRGHDVTVFASSFHHYLHRETRLRPGQKWGVEEVDGVRWFWIRTPPYKGNDWRRVWNMSSFALRAWLLGQKLERVVPNIGTPNVVVGSSPHLLTTVAAWRIARTYDAAFVLEIRDLWPQTIVDMGEMREGHPVVRALRLLEVVMYRRADRIITLLPLAHEYITRCGIPVEKIVWIPNGVNLDRLKSTLVSGNECSRDEREFRVMYLGAHGRANALDVVIEAARIIQASGDRRVRVSLIGDGPEKPRLLSLTRQQGVRNVEFCSPVSKSDVPVVLSKADALLLNLGAFGVFRYGVSANKLFDYMAAGKPVIVAVDAPENPVEKSGCGVCVTPGDPEALARAILSLSRLPPAERDAMGKRGRAYVEEHHDVRRLATKLEGVLKDVLRGW